MKIKCQKCQTPFRRSETTPKTIIKFGSFYRSSDRKHVQRFFCKPCRHHFSVTTCSDHYRQKKRHLNHQVVRLLVALVSIRESQRILKINRKTVVRKLTHMGTLAPLKLNRLNAKRPKIKVMEFDDMETFEHTKCKPLSITLAVESQTRWILGFSVSQMPAKGLLAEISRKRYGVRKDLRARGRARLFKTIQSLVEPQALIKSDQNPHYTKDVKRFFPEAQHVAYKGRDGCVVGQGELKKIGFDPIFSLNHTCAVFRARASRLIRRTWCTTKKPERLNLHLALVALHHNLNLLKTTG